VPNKFQSSSCIIHCTGTLFVVSLDMTLYIVRTLQHKNHTNETKTRDTQQNLVKKTLTCASFFSSSKNPAGKLLFALIQGGKSKIKTKDKKRRKEKSTVCEGFYSSPNYTPKNEKKRRKKDE